MTFSDLERRDVRSRVFFGESPYIRSCRLTNSDQIWHGNLCVEVWAYFHILGAGHNAPQFFSTHTYALTP